MNLEYFKRGYAAVELLVDRIMSPSAQFETRLVPTSLVIRQSCGCFEKSVVDAGNHSLAAAHAAPPANASEAEVRTYLLAQVIRFLHRLQRKTKKTLLTQFFSIFMTVRLRRLCSSGSRIFFRTTARTELIPDQYARR
jgi:hypothetical protein